MTCEIQHERKQRRYLGTGTEGNAVICTKVDNKEQRQKHEKERK